MVAATSLVLQLGSPTPGVGPQELDELLPVVVGAGWFFVGVVAVVLVGWGLIEPAIGRMVARRNRHNPTLQEAITRYVRLTIVVLGVLVGVVLAGYGRVLSDSALVVAAATLALGVAAQTVIGSLVSGLVLVSDPEFNVGDYIEWTDGAGVVQSITLRVTRVLTPAGELVTVPNRVLTDQAVTRPYGRGRYRLESLVAVAAEADVDAALGELEAAATGLEGVLADPPPRAYVDEFDDDAVVVSIHYWLADPRDRDVIGVRSAFARAAKARLDAADIEARSPPPSERHSYVRIDRPE